VSLETEVKALTEAMNRNSDLLERALSAGVVPGGKADAPAASGDKPPKGKPGPKPKDDGPKITDDAIRAALNKVKEELGTPAAKKIIADHGATDLANLCTMKSKFQAIIDACEAVLTPADDADEGEGEGDDDL
jgi:hypothetical protein